MAEENSQEKQKQVSKEEIEQYLGDIEEKVINSNGAYLHSIIALNQILRLPGVEQLLDAKMKERIHDVWLKLKSLGVQVMDPPMLFGLPESFNAESEAVAHDDEEEIEIGERPPKDEMLQRQAERESTDNEELNS